jgi:type II secretory ATPase GspE/PulE/Tfp pilus assembly ATPase PilB-like protein
MAGLLIIFGIFVKNCMEKNRGEIGMGVMADQYLIFCWHCQAEFDALSAADCGHANPTKTCPFCLKCFCDASKDYKKKYLKNCPKEILAEFTEAKDSLYMKIGEILVKAGKISVGQLDTALDKQRIVNKKLGEVLIMMSLVTPDELQLYLLNQKSVETIDLKNLKVDGDLVRQIGKDFCLDQKIVPIEIQEIAGGRMLRFAFYSISELPKLKKRSELQNFKLIPYLAPKEEIETMLQNMENTEKEIKIYTSLASARHLKLLNSLIRSAVQSKVSDVFFEFKSGQLKIFFRNGELLTPVQQAIEDPQEFFVKVKEICGIRSAAKNSTQESFLQLNKNLSHLKIKVLFYSGSDQENIRFKLSNLNDFAKKITDLNLENDEVDRLRAILEKPNGLFIVAGPVYSKANETLYALMNTMASERIATVENDVVLRNERFFQIENQGSDVTNAVYKNLLFYKPDSMFLFDYFQKNYDNQFLHFVGMGKLFIELQGFSYEEIFGKMVGEYDVPLSYLAENLRLLIFQRQAKILCPACKTPNPHPARELFKNKRLSGNYPIFQEKGCAQCQSSGYSRDEVFYEIFTMDNHERSTFKEEHLFNLDKKISEAGSLTISQKVVNRVLKGEISYRESCRFF